ncbi:MAG TPA: rhodanese-like domain-containing protein [Gammaproteobacteria bacterium]|nr:rhodanese-like domain-containing protein [Gammaproteobacteria bacterium]
MKRISILMLLALLAPAVMALEVKLTPDRDYVEVIHQGRLVKVMRIQDQDHKLEGSFAKTSRKCPPFCIQPMDVAPGVKTIGQVELFDFMEQDLLDGTGLLIDARTPSWWKRGTIPGSINIPFTVFDLDKDDPKLLEVMDQLGVRRRNQVGGFTRMLEKTGLLDGDEKTDDWDFSRAKTLVLWCNGMWCGQSPRAIRGLLRLGYPAKKIRYYRGGMQAWQSLGLTVVEPE